MLGNSLVQFVKYNVPDDGACWFHSMAISLMTLVREDKYRFSEAFKDYFKLHLTSNILDIVNYKLSKQHNKKAIDFSKIISPQVLNSVFQKILDDVDLNQFVLSINHPGELYSFMYILTSIWIKFLQSECNIAEAIDTCGDLQMWEIAKFMGIEFEEYETQWKRPIHRYYRDSIYTKPKIIMHYDYEEGHAEPLISSEIKCGFIELLSPNDVVKIDRSTVHESEMFWWGYGSRLADCIKPLIFSSDKRNNEYKQPSSNDAIPSADRSLSLEVKI